MKKILLLGMTILLLLSCGDAFDIHPYDVDVEGETDINSKQMAKIENLFADKETLRVAFISDTHLWLSDARDQIDDDIAELLAVFFVLFGFL